MKRPSKKHLRFIVISAFAMLFLTACDHDGDGGDAGDEGEPMIALEINPSSLEINTESPQTIVFSVSGGVPPYRWSVSNPELGSIDGSGEQVLYESSTATGANIIMAVDGIENVGSVIVQQF